MREHRARPGKPIRPIERFHHTSRGSIPMDVSDRGQDVLEIDKLSINYGARQVLKALYLRIRSGEIFGLLGPNGAGKTSLVRTICGRIRPASGTILIGGKPHTQGRVRRRIGLVPQEIALYPHMSARENLMVFARIAGLSRSQITRGGGPCRRGVQTFGAGRRLRPCAFRRLEAAAPILPLPFSTGHPCSFSMSPPSASISMRAMPCMK